MNKKEYIVNVFSDAKSCVTFTFDDMYDLNKFLETVFFKSDNYVEIRAIEVTDE